MTLAAVLTALVPAFGVTSLVVDRYKHQRQDLAADWSERGRADLPTNPAAAVTDFETALAYSRDQGSDRLHLAEALIASKRPAEAEAHLLTLWSQEPGRGDIALNLARLTAARNDLSRAVPYYHAAIDGAWEGDAPAARRGARLELARLLLLNGQNISAQAELIALINDLPPDANLITEVGGLLVQSGADTRAATLFDRALALDPRNAAAARLAGQVAFRAANYRDAQKLLAQAGAEQPPLDAESADMLDLSARVLAHDPAARGLPARSRGSRLFADFQIARDRLARCQASPSAGAPPGSDQLAPIVQRVEAVGNLRETALQRDADLSDEVLSLSFDIATLPTALCGAPTPDERALQLIADRRRAPQQ